MDNMTEKITLTLTDANTGKEKTYSRGVATLADIENFFILQSKIRKLTEQEEPSIFGGINLQLEYVAELFAAEELSPTDIKNGLTRDNWEQQLTDVMKAVSPESFESDEEEEEDQGKK